MALDDQSALSTLLDALTTAAAGTLMRRILQGALQGLIDVEAEHHIGAGLHERAPWPARRTATAPATV